MRKIIKRIISKPLQWWAAWYFKKPRKYNYKHIKGVILPGVFYPYFTISTKLLLSFLEPLDLQNKKIIELGCGTGLISVLSAKKGAQVIASDINPKAIENVKLNASKNGVEVEAILSDLFTNIPKQVFDYIIINPPYYPKDPSNHEEQAWFCGENFEYFERLFNKLGEYVSANSRVYMVLSEDCELKNIQSIAGKNKLYFKELNRYKKMGEWSMIYQVS